VLTMNSVKILHAVRSAITATAELLVDVAVRTFPVLQTYVHRHQRSQGSGPPIFDLQESVNALGPQS